MDPDVEEGKALAATALRRWDLRVTSIELVNVSENQTFELVTADGSRFAVRVHRPGYNSIEELTSENEWVEALARAGIGVAVPVRSIDGSSHVLVEHSDGTPRHVGVSQWVEGSSMGVTVADAESETDTRALFEQLGSQMANLHNHTQLWEPPSGFQRRAWDLDGLYGDTPHWGRFWEAAALGNDHRDLFEEARNQLRAEMAEFGQTEDRFGLIHADLHMGNVLDSSAGLVIIDFDDCGSGWHMYDLAVALTRPDMSAQYSDRRDAAVRGYRTERDLPEEHLDRLASFVLTRGLALVGWANDRPELGHDDGDEMVEFIAQTGEQAERYLKGESPV